MPKAKDFFTLLKQQGKITDPKYDELIEKAPDFEIPDEAVRAFENSFFTLDRAVTHKDVVRRLRSDALDPIDKDFEKIIQTIKAIDKTSGERIESLTRDINAQGHRVPDTYKRMEALSSSLGELFNKVKTAPSGGDEEIKKELEAKKKVIEEFADKFTNAEKEYKNQIQQKEKEFENKLHEYKLDGELEKLAGTFTLAEAFEKTRKDINQVVLSGLKSANKLRLGEKDGQTQINVLDDRGEPRYNGNSPVTINQLLEEKYKPFLKQSSAEPPRGEPARTTFTSNGNQNPTLRRGVPTQVKSKS